jgi:hypothetical protein
MHVISDQSSMLSLHEAVQKCFTSPILAFLSILIFFREPATLLYKSRRCNLDCGADHY